MSKVLRREMAIVMLIYLLVGISGYVTYADNIEAMGANSDILYGNKYQGQFLVTLVNLTLYKYS